MVIMVGTHSWRGYGPTVRLTAERKCIWMSEWFTNRLYGLTLMSYCIINLRLIN